MTLKFKELIVPPSSDVEIDFLVIVKLENDGTEPEYSITGELVLSDGLEPLEATETVRRIESVPGGASTRMTWAVMPKAAGNSNVKIKLECEGEQPQEKSVDIEIKKPGGD